MNNVKKTADLVAVGTPNDDGDDDDDGGDDDDDDGDAIEG